MRINKISVTKLLGVFNHQVSFNMEDRITIIHGPNGFGKTALLRIINNFFNSRYSQLCSIPFTEFRIDFDEGSHLQITNCVSKVSKKKKDQPLKFNYHYHTDSKSEDFSPDLSVDSNSLGMTYQKFLRSLRRPELLKEISLEDDLDRWLDENSVIPKKEPNWLSELKSSFHVRLIESQRLLHLPDPPKGRLSWESPSIISSVDTYSQELAKNIETKLTEYGVLSQALDRTFPARVVNNRTSSDLTEEKLHNQLKEIEEKRSRLREIGLLEQDESPYFQIEQDIDETTKNILSVYVEDVEKKLMVFKELGTKIELFQRIIKQRFLYKNMSISKKNGFTFTTADGKPLSPTDLSSGEQHELVMLYELLFKIEPNSLILIDEPEISLHLAWQVQFLKDLQAIIKLADFDVLIATHAPGIIDDRWDLTVELKGPVA